MKTTIIILIVFVSKMYSQDLDALKASDTIYINFNNDIFKKLKNLTFKSLTNGDMNEYFIQANNSHEIVIKTYKKSFFTEKNFKICNLKKFKLFNKDKIITLEFIEKFGLFEIFLNQLNYKKKKIFIIDEINKKNRKIIKRTIISDNREIIQ